MRNHFSRRMAFVLILTTLMSPLTVLAEDSRDYKPYEKDEFPPWLRGIRRAETVAVGSFPFTYIITSLTADMINFSQSGNAAYLPGPFGEGESPQATQEEMIRNLQIALSLSLVIALADYLLGLRENR